MDRRDWLFESIKEYRDMADNPNKFYLPGYYVDYLDVVNSFCDVYLYYNPVITTYDIRDGSVSFVELRKI